MKILVIDDKQEHLDSAKRTLAGHELTVIDSYDAAFDALGMNENARGEFVYHTAKERGIKSEYEVKTEEERVAAREAMASIAREYPPIRFDAVLTDLLMPAGRKAQGPKGEQFVGKEMPVGFALALMAVVHGARFVGVVTDTNHHDHPAAAMLDPLTVYGWHDLKESGARFTVNGARLGLFQVGGTKDWGKILSSLMVGS